VTRLAIKRPIASGKSEDQDDIGDDDAPHPESIASEDVEKAGKEPGEEFAPLAISHLPPEHLALHDLRPIDKAICRFGDALPSQHNSKLAIGTFSRSMLFQSRGSPLHPLIRSISCLTSV